MKAYYTEYTNFYGNTCPYNLLEKYGSPLYVYNESILRQRCREMIRLVQYPNFKVSYSTKANSNLELLKIIHDEGVNADAMSPGEIYVLIAAGFTPQQIFYISNNVSEQEMQFAIEKGITVSIDSLCQLEQFGRINQGGKVAVRFNPGVGAGHNDKVITGGKKTKFGIDMHLVSQVKEILKKYNLKLVGINQHIGSLFMESKPYIAGVKSILSTAKEFDDLEFIDLGGGFGVPYNKQDGEARLDLEELGSQISEVLYKWTADYGKEILFKIEPGRYIVAECGVLLGRVNSIKQNYHTTYVGTDLGFNVFMRPVLYDSYHDVEVYRNGNIMKGCSKEPLTIVGNICESGDIIAYKRSLPNIQYGDILGVMDAGAYGYSMSSNYNNRLRPAEVLIKTDGQDKLIRRRDTLEDLLRNF